MDSDPDKQDTIGIFTTDTKFVVRVWDSALERMTKISAAGARGRSVVETIPDLAARGLLARFTRVLEEGTIEVLAPAFHRFLIECPPQSASSHFAEMRQRVTIAPLRENELICGLIVTVEDVTARMEREMELTGQLKNSDETIRLEAAKRISNEPESLVEENAAPLIEALADKSWRVRRRLVQSLSRRAAPEAIAALLRAVRDRHLDFAVLNSALQILQASSVKTTETLIEFLRGDDADLRMQAALMLGEQNDALAIPVLLAALEDENSNVRYHAIEALGKLKAAVAVEPLLEIAETGDFFLSFVALDALRHLADERHAPRILPLLQDDFLREAAVAALGAIGDEQIVAPLIDLLNKDKASTTPVAHALASLSGRFENDSAKSEDMIERARKTIDAGGKANLLAALDESSEIDLTALAGLGGWFGDERIREKLLTLLENENVREEAARALGRQGAAAVDSLLELLETNDPELSRTVARVLGQIGDARAFEPLVELLKTGDAAARQAAVGALRALAHPETIPVACALLADSDAGVREAAIRVVGHFGAKGCEQKIFESCQDTDERVRRAAIEQLPNVDDRRAVETLIDVLKTGPSRERETAAKALAPIKNVESVRALREALLDADAWTRYFAIRALGAAQDANSRETLVKMAENDAAEQVRAAAREVLSELKA